VHNTRLLLAAIAAAMISATPVLAQTASSPKWFVPKTAAAPSGTAAPVQGRQAAAPAAQTSQIGLPPLPNLPQVPQGTSPPAAVIGVLDVEGVVRSSTAYVAVQNEMRAREAKLQADAQAAQSVYADMKQKLLDQQKTLTANELSQRNAAISERIANDEATFKARDQRIQDAGNYSVAQIQEVLQRIVQQVAQSHNMNIVLYQTAVVLGDPGFNISAQVAQELNQVLPTVLVPPDGADVAAFARAHQARAGK